MYTVHNVHTRNSFDTISFTVCYTKAVDPKTNQRRMGENEMEKERKNERMSK